MKALVARAAACVLVAASVPLAPGDPALGATLAAVPATVRVNVTGLGISYAILSSTGTVTATAPDGRVLYSGGLRTLARTNVRRVDGTPIDLSPLPDVVTREDRMERLAFVRDARRAALEAGADRRVVTIPFEFSLLRTSEDQLGAPILSEPRVVGVRFATEDGLLLLNGKGYRGTLELATDDGGDMVIVNTIPTGEYLASVVGAEEPYTWEPEALAAQAVAARTYLVTHLRRHNAYDLEGDTRDQEYGGVGSEAPSTIRAVERTAGVIATYRGAAIEALYSANAGGVTEDSENVFVNALPYLRSVPSPGDEVAKDSSWGKAGWEWTRELTAPQLRGYLSVRGFDVGEPLRVDLVQVAPSGRVLLARVVGTRGTRTIGKDASRYYFGLRSSLFTVELRGGGETEWVPYADLDRQRALEFLGAWRLATVYTRLGSDGQELLDYRVSEYLYELPARFVFKGKGFGHGVGMSQWGAQAMAMKGASAEQILKYYYQGIALTSVGGP